MLEDAFTKLPTGYKSLEPQILGRPGSDNAVFVKVSAGQATFRALFDCGAGCLNQLPVAEIGRIDAIFFSHLHFDHVAGFDHFLRINYDRTSHPVRIFGPARTSEILHHRLQGVLWDRVGQSRGEFQITDIDRDIAKTHSLKSTDGFQQMREIQTTPFAGLVFENSELAVEAVILDHGSPSLGYCLATKATEVVNSEKLKSLGLAPGVWLKQLKNPKANPNDPIEMAGINQTVGQLRSQLLETKPGEKIGYLTDFQMTHDTASSISKVFQSCHTLICENNYRDCDSHLALKNFHITSSQASALACAAQVEKLVLFHLSDRYTEAEWLEQLQDVRQGFSRTYFPEEWRNFIIKTVEFAP